MMFWTKVKLVAWIAAGVMLAGTISGGALHHVTAAAFAGEKPESLAAGPTADRPQAATEKLPGRADGDASAAARPDLPVIKHDWPGYTGPDGTFADQSKVPILDDLSRARLVWVSEHDDLGWGKTYSGGGTGCYPKTMAPSGSASLIVANGLVIAAYFSPRNSAVADDIILALDATTGKTRWKQVYAGKGINRGANKHPDYGPTPASADGKVFHLGSSGRVYCVELTTGKTLWESALGEIHKELEAIKAKTPVNDNRIDGIDGRTPFMCNPLIVIDGVLMIPAAGQLFGFDCATGKLLWQIKAGIVPCPAKLGGKMYALTQCDGHMQLVRPRTGEVLWKERLGANFLAIVADGRAFVPRLKDPSRPKTGNERPTITAFALSETGAKMLWQSDFPMPGGNGVGWHAYRDGVVYASASANPGGQFAAFRAEDGTLLGRYDDKKGDQGRFQLWGGHIVILGDNHHESINSACYYWSLTDDLKNLEKSGKPHVPRWNANGYRGVCGYEVLMRDPYADGYQFTRAIDTAKAKGVIMCWDLRARAAEASVRFRIDAPLRGLSKKANFGLAEALLDGDKITQFVYEIPAGGQPRNVLLKESMPFAQGRGQGEVPVAVLVDVENWKLDIKTDGSKVSGTYERQIPALKKTTSVEGTATVKMELLPEETRRWTFHLTQAILRSVEDTREQRRDMAIVLDRLVGGEMQGSARGWGAGTHEVDVSHYEADDARQVLKATVLRHSDTYLAPSAERRGTVAMEVNVSLTRDGETWKGTYTARHGVAWSCKGRIDGIGQTKKTTPAKGNSDGDGE